MKTLMASSFGLLRHEPLSRRLRGLYGGVDVISTRRPLVVWEPRRVVPTYAVPVEDLRASLVPSSVVVPDPGGVLTPDNPFAVHTASGSAVDLSFGSTVLPGAGFRYADSELDGYVGVDFDAFEHWYEENVERIAHPRDPYHRVDVLPSSRHVRILHEGVVLAESTRPTLVCETFLPTRFYVPRSDLLAPASPSARRTSCAYKGRASYLTVGGLGDIAWTYAEPLDGVTPIAGLVAFYDDVLDVYLDGELRERPATAVSKTLTTHLRPAQP